MDRPRVLIIGAGPGGLASAMLLAAAGCEVRVIERQRRVGGRTSTLEVDGFRFDRGPTFFLYPEVLESIFAMCGRRLRDEVTLVPLDPHYRLAFEDGTRIEATARLAALKRQIARLDADDAARVDAYLDANRRKFAAFRPIFESSFDSHSDLLKLPLLELLGHARPWSSVDADLRRFFRDPRVRLAFSFQSKYLGMSPFKCPSLFTILAFLEYEYGVHHPIGGCGAVSAAMERIARELGVTFELGEPVEEILFDGRRARAVRTASTVHACDAVVVNADFADAMRRLVPDRLRRRWSDRRIGRKKMSCSTFMLYLGIEGRYEKLAHHTILLADGYARHLADNEQHHRLPANPSIYVHNPSLVDGSLAPEGMSALYVLAPVTHVHANVDWAREAPAFRRRVLAQLAKLGLDDLPSRIRSETVFTPSDWERQMRLYRGATFSLAHTLDQMLSFRPHNRFEDLDGVYLVGGGTHPGSGLPVIYQSAKISTQLLLEDLGVRDAWQPAPPAQHAWRQWAQEGA